MKRKINNIISVVYSLIRFCCIKVFHWNAFRFKIIERFSPNTNIEIREKGKIILHKKIRAHSRTKISVSADGIVEIGENTAINQDCIFVSHKRITIGNNCTFGPGVQIYDHDHDYSSGKKMNGKEFKCDDVNIGNNCWIGANTIILRGTVIGDNCVVGAGSVIKGTYGDNLKIIQKRDTEIKEITKSI